MDQYERIRRVARAFELEVPEYRDGVVELVAVASEPGTRTKVAVRSSDADLDPIGACVGEQGARIRAIVEHLGGERLDVVPFDENPVRLVCHALAPAPINRVLIDEASHKMELVVDDAECERALGKDGINLRLAAELSGWSLALVAQSKFDAAKARLREHLSAFDAELAEHLFRCGYNDIAHLAAESPEQLAEFAELPIELAREVVAAATKVSEGP